MTDAAVAELVTIRADLDQLRHDYGELRTMLYSLADILDRLELPKGPAPAAVTSGRAEP